MPMRIEFDTIKNERNIRERGLTFGRAAEFVFETALIEIDDRNEYGESRLTAIGKLDDIPHVLIFTMRNDVLRVISFSQSE